MRRSLALGLFVCLFIVGVSRRGEATTIVLTFEDRPDVMATQPFGPAYMGVTWNNWLEYAPYTPNGYAPNGINAIFAASAANATPPVNSFTFADSIFDGASFSISANSPSVYFGTVYFELYLNGSLVHTSGALSSGTNTLTFLSSGYSGLVDEVRVLTTGTLMTPGGSAWIMDDVSFETNATPAPVPEPASLLLVGSSLVGLAARWRRRRGLTLHARQ